MMQRAYTHFKPVTCPLLSVYYHFIHMQHLLLYFRDYVIFEIKVRNNFHKVECTFVIFHSSVAMGLCIEIYDHALRFMYIASKFSLT
jgi:hypothetical protein